MQTSSIICNETKLVSCCPYRTLKLTPFIVIRVSTTWEVLCILGNTITSLTRPHSYQLNILLRVPILVRIVFCEKRENILNLVVVVVVYLFIYLFLYFFKWRSMLDDIDLNILYWPFPADAGGKQSFYMVFIQYRKRGKTTVCGQHRLEMVN